MTETPTDMIARLTGFTPGPWKWDERQSGTYAGVEDVFWIEEYAGEAWLEFAQGCDEAEANAALIAAAPDLHAAVVELLAWKAAALAREAALRDALRPCVELLDGLVHESGRALEWGHEDPFRMGEWFDESDIATIETARAALEVKQ